jgi:hypothetical protein
MPKSRASLPSLIFFASLYFHSDISDRLQTAHLTRHVFKYPDLPTHVFVRVRSEIRSSSKSSAPCVNPSAPRKSARKIFARPTDDPCLFKAIRFRFSRSLSLPLPVRQPTLCPFRDTIKCPDVIRCRRARRSL